MIRRTSTPNLTASKTWAGQAKSGVAIRLDADNNGELQNVIQDDLTDLLEYKCNSENDG